MDNTPNKTYTASDNKYIYHFVLNEILHYVGKYSKDTFYQYHLHRSAPPYLKKYFPTAVKEDSTAWESEWQREIINKGVWDSTLINSLTFNDYSSVLKNIKTSLNQLIASSDTKYNFNADNIIKFIAQVWRKSEYEITESIAIALADIQFNHLIVNTQIDFMGRDVFSMFRSAFDKHEIGRKLKVKIKNKSKWFISVDWGSTKPRNINKDIVNKLKHEIQNKGWKIEKINTFSGIDNPELMLLYYQAYPDEVKKINERIQDELLNTLDMDYAIRNTDSDKKTIQEIKTSISKLTTSLNNDSKEFISNIKTIRQAFNKLSINWNKELTKIQNDSGLSINEFNTIIQQWFAQTPFEVLDISQSVNITKANYNILHDRYKKNFTNVMQDTMNQDNIGIRNTKRVSQERIHKMSKNLNPYFGAKKRLNPKDSFKNHTKKFGNFITTNWEEIWQEQSQILYHKNGMDYTKIKWY